MKSIIKLSAFIVIGLFSLMLSLHAGPQESPLASGVIDVFYKNYLNWKIKSGEKKPELKFSKSLQKLIRKNKRICKENAGSDVCGWGADSDIYLNAEEIDPKLSYENSSISVLEKDLNTVQVKFNVYPSLTESKSTYDREIDFKVLLEAGHWVVDDIRYGAISARGEMQREIQSFQKLKQAQSKGQKKSD